MNAIRNVFTAFSNLASSVNSLAAVIDIATGKLRQQLALDAQAHNIKDGTVAMEASTKESTVTMN
jgi:hypothetical protein